MPQHSLHDGVPLRLRLLQVVLVFPGPRAVSVQDMMKCLHDRSHDSADEPCRKRLKTEQVQGSTRTSESSESGTPDEAKSSVSKVDPLHRVVFIDSTWNQTNKISTDERLQGNHERLHLSGFPKNSRLLVIIHSQLNLP